MTDPRRQEDWRYSATDGTPSEGAKWDPMTGQYQAVGHQVDLEPPTIQEQWVYVDPSSYSNPYTEAPVYTSGPQPAAPPAPPQAPLSPSGPQQTPLMVPAPSFMAPPAPSVAPANYPPPPGTPVAPLAPDPYGPVEGGLAAPVDPLLAADYQPERGELKIKERRTWKTWQLLTAVVIAAVLGMWFNGNSGSASGIPGASGSGGTSGGGYKLPPAAGSPSTTTAAAGGAATSTTAAGGATTTTAAGSATSTTAAGSGSTTTAPVVLAPPSVLVPETQQAGNWTSPAFTIAGGTWNIGWAFQCVPVPTATPTFQIFVVNNGAAPGSTPAVTSSAASGNAVTPLTSTGSQQVIVQTAASCRWAVKVTGSGS